MWALLSAIYSIVLVCHVGPSMNFSNYLRDVVSFCGIIMARYLRNKGKGMLQAERLKAEMARFYGTVLNIGVGFHRNLSL